MLPAAMNGLGLVLLAALLCSAPGECGGAPRARARSPEEPEAAPERAGLRGRHPPTVPVTSTPSPGPWRHEPALAPVAFTHGAPAPAPAPATRGPPGS
ncbi:hypothetical protein GH733_008181 [Mirounga leonina]|nr:hypothetical protein GH733_008181 [Mirounga leonina]